VIASFVKECEDYQFATTYSWEESSKVCE